MSAPSNGEIKVIVGSPLYLISAVLDSRADTVLEISLAHSTLTTNAAFLSELLAHLFKLCS